MRTPSRWFDVRAVAGLVIVGALALVGATPAEAAVTADLVGSELRVIGDAANDFIAVSLVSGDSSLIVVLLSAIPIGTFARSSVTTILVDAGAGNDQVEVQDSSGTFTDTIPTTILGGDGTDSLVGGRGPETLRGGGGNDRINGGGGNDTMSGDEGDDLLVVGAIHESSVGFGGGGSVSGGPGSDRVVYKNVQGAVGVTYTITPVGNTARLVNSVGPSVLDLSSIAELTLWDSTGSDSFTFAADVGALIGVINVRLAEGADTVYTTASSPRLVLTDTPPATPADADTLVFDALGRPIHWQRLLPDPPLHPNTGVSRTSLISTDGTERVRYGGWAQASFTGSGGGPPTVALTTPTAVSIASLPPVASEPIATPPFLVLAGTAAGGSAVASVTWSVTHDGIVTASGTAIGTTAWSAPEVPVQRGLSSIAITATDAAGNRSTFWVWVSPVYRYSLAEGATGAFFDFDLLLSNADAVTGTLTFLRENGSPVVMPFEAHTARVTAVRVDNIPGLEDVSGISTVVEANGPLAVERTMYFNARHYGAHTGTAVDAPRTRWLFAEGAEGTFHTFVLLANTGAVASTATVKFLREGAAPVTRTVNVPPTSRVTLATSGIAELANRSFAIAVDATAPIVAERSMYFGTARLFDGGHESAGVPAGSTSWFLAEGATGSYFTTFVLVANPNATPANVTMTYLTEAGRTIVRNRTIPANGRLTVNLALEDPSLANAAVSTTITADQPIVAERSMYWPGGPAGWLDGHNSFGVTGTWPRWLLAEGVVGGPAQFHTYILLANPSATVAQVRVTYLLQGVGGTIVRTYDVAPRSRYTIDVHDAVPEIADRRVGAFVEVTNGVGISVERSMYANADGRAWDVGTNAPATRVP